MSNLTHVAVAIMIKKSSITQCHEVLVSLRDKTAHQGGLWEFPGGKLEDGESSYEALKREVSEELGVVVNKAKLFKTIRHQYSDKPVLLDVWWVESFDGEFLYSDAENECKGAEGQSVKWQPLKELKVNDFPTANRPIVYALTLPEKYMITGGFETQADFMLRLENSLKNGISLVQLRCKKTPEAEIIKLAGEAQLICKQYNARLLLNTTLEVFNQLKADGLHLSSQQLYKFKKRPVDNVLLLSVSCHTQEDIMQADKLSADIILLSPVKETKSHPGVKGIGWSTFSDIVFKTATPVYALGGMNEADIIDAKQAGAQGVAAISSFWNVR
ncbi:hypothetical protein MNBD_GAMMA09-619 [hydrothermal vent metagenome]|uniref:8-oxo-dGTP diphosphatase n=1 Tax=hydrothermal vent metagenome TaxID=652676 RepID=A0A3B0XSW1_9ZZZZ